MIDTLLFSLSSYGTLSFEVFEKILNLLFKKEFGNFESVIPFTDLVNNTLSSLDELSHCECDYSKRRIYVCPPSLVLLPQFGLPKAILIGARTPEILKKCEKFVRENESTIYMNTTIQASNLVLAPNLIMFEAVDIDTIREMAVEAKVAFQSNSPAAWQLLNFSSDINKVQSKLNFYSKPDFNWKKRVFDYRRLVFCDYNIATGSSWQLAEYTNKYSFQKIHYIWEADKAAIVDRNWGRYLILQKERRRIITYDIKRFILGVPVSVPLPRLISRGAVLCTGRLPLRVTIHNQSIHNENFNVQVYQSVAPVIAELIAKKIGQQLLYNKILIPKEYLYA